MTLGRQSPDSTDKVTTPQLTQINGACAFILRLSDGRFLVIDGGLNYEKNWKSIYEQLVAQNVRGGKPVIAAWILSHAHVDHYGGFIGFAEHYGEKVTSGIADGKFSARFSAILKNYDLEAYQEVGFAVTLGDKTVEKSGTTVYSTLSEGTGAHLASEFGGSYFFTLNLTDIPATGTQTVTVRVFAVNSNGVKVYESITYTATFANGECEIAVSANA